MYTPLVVGVAVDANCMLGRRPGSPAHAPLRSCAEAELLMSIRQTNRRFGIDTRCSAACVGHDREFRTSYLQLNIITIHVPYTVFDYTQGEVTSQNLWPRYDRHFVGITWQCVELRGEDLSCYLNNIQSVGL